MSSAFIDSPARMLFASVITITIALLAIYAVAAKAKEAADTNPDLSSWWTRCGLIIMFVGSLPLVFYLVAAEVGLLSNPDNHMVGPGVLMGFSFVFGMISIKCGDLWRRFRR